ncbi:MAG TPA: isochorismatase family protein [Stellaceae bacterium]|jgi:nicotinamidase-related amidase
MLIRSWRGVALAVIALSAVIGIQGTAAAQTIIDQWSSTAVPPAPELKPARLDAKTTGLIVMDFVKQTCNEKARPSCVASLPKVKAMIAAAKAKNVAVIWTIIAGPKIDDYLPDVAPPAGTQPIVGQIDKFVGTDLEKTLKDKGITTVVLTGTSAHGAVLFTAAGAAMRGFNVVVPVDGMSAAPSYAEQATAWMLANLPGEANKVTLTRGDMITYQ